MFDFLKRWGRLPAKHPLHAGGQREPVKVTAMPEMSNDDIVTLQRYRAFGTVDDVQKKINGLEKDNADQRTEIAGWKAKAPKDDEIVVKKADADELGEWRKLGKKPSEVKGTLEKGLKAQEDLVVRDQRDAALKFVKAVGLAEESVDTIIAIPQLKDAKFEVRKGKVKNPRTNLEEDGDVGYVTLAGDNQKAMNFTDAQEQVAALKGLKPAGPQAPATKPTTTFVQQGSQGSPGDGTVYDRIRNRNKPAGGQQQTAPNPPAVTPEQAIRAGLGMTK